MSDVAGRDAQLKAWKTVGNSFAFARGNYFTILRNVSALMVILIALVAWNLYTLPPATAADIEQNTAAAWDFMSHFYLYALLAAIPVLSILVAVYRSYYEGASQVGFYLRFGGGELRIVAATLLVAAIMFVLVAALAIVLIVALVGVIFYGAQTGVDMDQLAQMMQTGASAEGVRPSFLILLFGIYAIGLIAFMWIAMWISARLITFYPDAVVSGDIRVGMNWSITKGHAWRIFLIILAYTIVSTIPFFLILGLLSVTLPGSFGDYFSLLIGQPGNEAAAPNLLAAITVAAVSQPMYLFLWIWSGALYCQIRDALIPETELDIY